MKKALIVVDAQYDFMPGGSLAVKEGDQIVPFINNLLPKYDLVIFTKDWHRPDNLYFASAHAGKNPFDQMEIHGKLETLWPDHCIQNTRGADIHDGINFNLIKGEYYIFKKGIGTGCHPYGGFGDAQEDTELHEFLQEKGVEEVDIVGLAFDFCVKDTAKDAAKLGYKTTVFVDGTRAINEDVRETLIELDYAGVITE